MTADYNGAEQEGVGYSQMTRGGRFRGSTARTFLAQARHRSNLKVITKSVATCLGFDGRRCTGVAFRRGDRIEHVTAAREVILCGGTVNSPHLLQVSGIGPAAYLKSIGVPLILDLPGVGSNLSDHFAARVSHRVKDEISVNELARGAKLLREIGRYAASGSGALTFGVTTAMVFCRSREGLASPNIQLLFTPGSYDPGGYGRLEREPGMTIAVCLARPDSRGTIMARSADPLERPAIRPNYLSASTDLGVLLAGIDHARRIFAAPALRQHSAAEVMPGTEKRTEQQLNEFLHRDGTNLHHPVGTCRMGEDPMAVVELATAGSWSRRAARHRCLGYADGDHRQHQCSDDHDRRERGRNDPRGRQGRLSLRSFYQRGSERSSRWATPLWVGGIRLYSQ